MTEKEHNLLIADSISAEFAWNGQAFQDGDFVALLDGKIIAVAGNPDAAISALRAIDPDPNRGYGRRGYSSRGRCDSPNENMTTLVYRSLDNAEVVDVEFLTLQGRSRWLKLLVDSGFTGKSSVLLGEDSFDLFMPLCHPPKRSEPCTVPRIAGG
jgi:hypothetical protein